MKQATAFMTENVGYQGGYVWYYLPDMSRRWGEMEGTPTMIWIQDPGTPAMGHLFLDAYHATGDEIYYQAAEEVAEVLIQCQHESGGWNYMADLAGEDSLQQWYSTIGKNGWRLEEFHHYYGNATFDDGTTSEAGKFILRMAMEKSNPRYKDAFDRVLAFVLNSQYPEGAWPQRYPLNNDFFKEGHQDYSTYLTFNDDVTADNLNFLILCYQTLGDTCFLEPIHRAMNSYIITQQSPPQAGWALQYTPDLQPAGARTYEPRSLVTRTTVTNIRQLLKFYSWTGDDKFLEGIPEALDWLDSVKLSPSLGKLRGTHPTFVELGTNAPLFVHRTGSNVINGKYYTDGNPQNTISHYSSFQRIKVDALRKHVEQVKSNETDEAIQNSPLNPDAATRDLPRFFCLRPRRQNQRNQPSESKVIEIINSLNAQGYWPSRLSRTSHPYKGDGPEEVTPGDFSQTKVGDSYDTSPYPSGETIECISTRTYIRNMSTLINYLESE
jgi:PelA/Pel-15E family pectate lyase